MSFADRLRRVPPAAWAALFAAAMLLMGLGLVGLHTTLQVHGTEISAAARGKAFSLFPASLFSGVAVGTAVMGALVDAGGEQAMLGREHEGAKEDEGLQNDDDAARGAVEEERPRSGQPAAREREEPYRHAGRIAPARRPDKRAVRALGR